MEETLQAEDLLNAYANGYFPMARSRKGKTLYWFKPKERGVLPLDNFHTPASLKKQLRKKPYRLSADTAFCEVITACADTPRNHEKGTWINDLIIERYTELHTLGFAHSVECWQGETLAGGLYGVSIGGAFFGESMFSHHPNASRIALVCLVEILRQANYGLLDTQYVNAHLTQFGVETIPDAAYEKRLRYALSISPSPSSFFSTVAGNICAMFSPG